MGMGVPVDSRKQEAYICAPAESGYLPAFGKVVEMYANGSKGVNKSNEKAREWLDKAIENDDSDAMLLKANAYFHGNYGYAKDMALAKKWLDNAKSLKIQM
jgi:TPR repeat protein